MKTFIGVLVITLFLTTFAFTHGNLEHLVGTVTAVSDHSISVKTTAGESKEVAVDGSTKYTRGDAPAALADIHIGDRIVIHAKAHEGKLQAAEVQLGKAKPGAKASSDAK
jgi:hypothetical protein